LLAKQLQEDQSKTTSSNADETLPLTVVERKPKTEDEKKPKAPEVDAKEVERARLLGLLELGAVRAAGMFLDGCTVYLAGWGEAEAAALAKVLKHAGAVRLLQLGERVSHVVAAGEVGEAVVAGLPHPPHLVSLLWVVESMRCGAPAGEAEFPLTPAVPEEQGEVGEEARVQEEQVEERGKFEASLLAQYGGDLSMSQFFQG